MNAPLSGPEGVYDPGLQPERTLLAWRRTCLSFGVASLIGMRVALPGLGLIAVLIGLLCVGLAVLAYTLAALGYSQAQCSLRTTDRLGRDAAPMAFATAAVVFLGLLCLVYLVTRSLRA